MIKAANVAKGSKVISRQRPQIIEEVNKLLLVFINEKQMKGDSLSEAFVCEKALDIYGDLVKKTLGANSKNSGIHSVLRHGDAASSNKKEAEKLKKEFSDLIKAGFLPHLAFNGDETSLF